LSEEERKNQTDRLKSNAIMAIVPYRRNLTGHKDYVLCLGLSDDDHYLSSGSGEGALKVWDLEAGVEVSNLVGHEAAILSIAFIASNEKVVSGSYDRTQNLGLKNRQSR
jgi:WD40 repeat protein